MRNDNKDRKHQEHTKRLREEQQGLIEHQGAEKDAGLIEKSSREKTLEEKRHIDDEDMERPTA